jgi:hypothetical protein
MVGELKKKKQNYNFRSIIVCSTTILIYFVAVNNFSKDAIDETKEDSNLEQARDAISQARGNLDDIINMLEPAT